MVVHNKILEEKPALSNCVENALAQLGRNANPKRKLTLPDVFVDVAKFGTGSSVARLRAHGVTPEVIDRLVGQLRWKVAKRSQAMAPDLKSQLKYYIYVSRTKVDMLYAQIPLEERRDLAAKLNLDLSEPAISVGPSAVVDEALLAKTNLVVELLVEKGLVGTVDRPKAYFGGQHVLRWGLYGGGLYGDDVDKFVYFGAEVENTIIGLGGSRRHVVGQVGASNPHSHSATPALCTILAQELGMELSESTESWLQGMQPRRGRDLNRLALRAVALASSQMDGPIQRIEFVARKLLDGSCSHNDGSNRLVVLGSPIYAALVDS
jgi:hypothetical protein